MKTYSTLSEAVNDLTRQGYTLNFNVRGECLECMHSGHQLLPDEFEIDAVYRFQEMSDVDNESILYAISSKTSEARGLLVNAYGIYADGTSAELIAKLVH